MPGTQESAGDMPFSAGAIAVESQFNLDTRIMQAGARVQRDEHAREPIPSFSKGAPNATSPPGSAQLHRRSTLGKGEEETPREQHRSRRPTSAQDAIPMSS